MAQEILGLKKPKDLPVDRVRDLPELKIRCLVSIWYHMILSLTTTVNIVVKYFVTRLPWTRAPRLSS